MKRANNQGPTDAFSSGAFLEVLATFPRCVMFLLCFSLAIRILCLATIFAAPPAPRTTRTRSLAAPGPPGGSARGTNAAYGHWAWPPSAGAPDHRQPPTTAVRAAEGRRAVGDQASGPKSKKPTTGQCSRQPRTSSGSAANVSTGQTPPRGSADSARSREGGRGRVAPQPCPSTLRKPRSRSCACALENRK